MPDNMSYTEVLLEMQELQKKWRDQCYTLTEEESERYELLVAVRRARVTQLYIDDRVYTGGMQS